MITMITGGSGSGKSVYAEDTLLSFGEGKRIYIATMYPFDAESHKRIRRHQKMREDKQFTTIERYTDLKGLEVEKDSFVLLECMSNLVANEMYQDGGAKEDTVEAVISGIRALSRQAKELCIVTNEIVSDGIDYEEETKRYQAFLGLINCEIGKIADKVVEVVYGIPLVLKETV